MLRLSLKISYLINFALVSEIFTYFQRGVVMNWQLRDVKRLPSLSPKCRISQDHVLPFLVALEPQWEGWFVGLPIAGKLQCWDSQY